MDLFSFAEIKAAGDCVAYCKSVLHLAEIAAADSKGRVKFDHPPWRPGSDSKGFLVWRDGFKDYAKAETGSILDLCARARHNDDIMQAQQELGIWLGLTPHQTVKPRARVIKEYIYEDLDGMPHHKTVRFEPKDFKQMHCDPSGAWHWGLGDIETIMYRLADWHGEKWVCVVGGEKDADNLLALGVPATTNAGGEGNWRDNYNASFAGKKVAILPDNDDAGRKHAQVVGWHLKDIAAAVKVVELPDLAPKGDVSDWLEAGGTKAQLVSLIANVKATEFDVKPEPPPPDISIAKRANEAPFSNYAMVEVATDTTGGTKVVKQPRTMTELYADFRRRFWTFPHNCGMTLFDRDRDTGHIRYLRSTNDLFAWIGEKSGHPVRWGRVEGAALREEFYSSVFANADAYQMISGTPHWPGRDDVFYTHGELPKPTPDRGYFAKLCAMFCPATDVDAHLIHVLMAAPMYFAKHVKRPMWVIDSNAGQGTGKTTLVEILGLLYGDDRDIESGDLIWIDPKQLNNDNNSERVMRRVLSKGGRKKRIAIIDNVTGYYRSPLLAQMVTQSSLSGLAPYGKDEESRPNDLTIILTSNSATLDKDLTSRSYFIEVRRPDGDIKQWERNVTQFVKAHRMQILSEIIDILKAGVQFDSGAVRGGRFATWDYELLAPMLGTAEVYDEVWRVTRERQDSSNGEQEEADEIRDAIAAGLSTLRIDPADDVVWIPSAVLVTWAAGAIPTFGGASNRGAMHHLRTYAKNGLITELAVDIKIYPPRGSDRSRGMMWNYSLFMDRKSRGERAKVAVLRKTGERIEEAI